MITEFITKYYLDPVRYNQPYNIVETLTFALILIVSLYLIYGWLKREQIAVYREFVLATVPFVVLGALVRTIYDTGMVTSDYRFLLVTPLIYVVMFFFTVTVLVVTRAMETRRLIRNYLQWYRNVGIVSAVAIALLLVNWGLTRTTIAIDVILIIGGMAVASSLALWGFLKYVLKWEYVSDPLFKILIFGQLLDASATAYGIDLHPLGYVEEHVVGSALIAWTGTAFVFFPLKLVVLLPAIYLMHTCKKEIDPIFWHLIILVMIIVGLGPGLRDMVQMALYV